MTPEEQTTQEREAAAEAAAPPPAPEAPAEAPAEGEESFDDAEAAPAVEPPPEVEQPAAPEDEAQRYLALAQRTQADFDNFRKRAARDAAAAADRGVSRLAKELLPALDHLELALQAAERDAAAAEFAKGVRLVQDEMGKALARVGIEGFSPQGEKFDPSEHEAMAQQPGDGAEPGTVIAVYQQGYRLNGTVLRPARVVVAG